MPKPLIEVLAENTRALMAERKLKQTHVKQHAATKGRVIDQRTVGRIAAAEYPAQISTIEALAAGIGVEAWQLLVPGLNPKSLPRPTPATPLSASEVDQVEDMLSNLRGLSPAQRDLFIQEGIVGELLRVEAYPPEKMRGNWTGPHAVQEPTPRYDRDKKTKK